MEIIGSLLSGLGLFFVGVKTVTKNLKDSSSRKTKLVLTRWIKNPILTGIWGFASGAMTQSSSGVTFVLVGFVSSGLISVKNALPLINWANIGTSSLIFFAAIDLKLLTFYLVGIGGLMLAFNKPVKLRKFFGIIYGIGLLFFGLVLLKQGSNVISDSETVKIFLLNSKGSLLLAFIAGALLRVIAQSSSAVSVIAITMAGAGLFTIEQTMMIIFGTNLGTGISTYFLSSNLKGTSRQIALFQVWLNLIGALIFVPLLYVEMIFKIPLLKELVTNLTGDLGGQMAYVYLANRLLTGIIVSPFHGLFTKYLEKYCKPSVEEEISKLEYVNDFMMNDPDIALELISKEQSRAAGYMSNYLVFLRNRLEKNNESFIPFNTLHTSELNVYKELEEYLTGLINLDLEHDTSERLINIQNRNSHLISLDNSFYELIKIIEETNHTENFNVLLKSILEASETILLTLLETLSSPDEIDIDVLCKISSDKSSVMEKIRKSFLTNEKELNEADRSLLLIATNGFEKITWITNNLALLIQNDYRKLHEE